MTNTPTGKGTAAAVPSDTTDRIRESYEVLPYPGGPHYGGHPDCLATVATLRGLAPTDVERCRVLDLGCATGGNLIPMAVALPHSDFVGVDLAPGQIAVGRGVVDALGLTNVRLVAADLRDFQEDPGSFDYVVCHGVYSWVPEDVRRRLLDRVAELLAPGGIAMVSFNTYPGSQPRDTVRGLFRFALEEVLAPGDPVEAARSLLRILPTAFEGVEGDFARQLRRIAEEHVDGSDHYLGHEFLEEVNQPCFVWEFVRAAEENGLGWMGDAWMHDEGEDLPPEARALVDKLSPGPVAREQWLDLLGNRAFRRGMLHKGGPEPADTMDASRVMELRASAGAWPEDGGARSGAGDPETPLSFSSRSYRVSTNIPIVTSALRLLWEAWPESIPVASLWERARDEARSLDAASDAPDDRAFFAGALLQCYRRHVVGLHVHRFPLTRRPPERPVASPLARYQAERGADVSTLMHQSLVLDPYDLEVLALLDGTRDRDALRAALEKEGEDARGERLEQSLEALGRAGVLLDR